MKRVVGFDDAMKLLRRSDPLQSLEGQPSLLEGIRATFGEPLSPVEVVERIVADVRTAGDGAILRYTKLISGLEVSTLEVARSKTVAAYAEVDEELVAALRLSASRIRSFHEACVVRGGASFYDRELGRKAVPLERVGLYVPGGRAAYPSSVLMSAVPAKVAGVEEIIVATPPGSQGEVPPAILVACDIAGVDRVFAIGGAQAIAALAYGTESVPRVDKICGPGNVFVTLAKKMVFGAVAIDSLAGPSEVLIVADELASPAYCAADILAQAEHDPQAAVVLVTTSAALADSVVQELTLQLNSLPRKGVVGEAVERGTIAVVDTLDEAVRLSNEFAPEHLELMVAGPRELLNDIRNAGCICLGGDSPVVMADYLDGPSHVLPTGGSARFSSGLGVEDFIKFSSIAHLSGATMSDLGPAAAVIARAEGLEAHARAIEKRLEST
ncbi:MAG: histidinol dehydrogenase [Chloroflexi bacterium]|nr:histidinol dehydrogenase [Chloroflexota bacterium]